MMRQEIRLWRSGHFYSLWRNAGDGFESSHERTGKSELVWESEAQEMAEIFLNTMPVKPENDEIVLKETLIFEVTGFDEYSENLIKSSTIKVWKIDFGKESIAETREIPYNNAVWSVHLERIYP